MTKTPTITVVKTKISRSNQTVVPKEVRRLWGTDNSELLWIINDSGTEITLKKAPANMAEWLLEAQGALSHLTRDENTSLDKLRDEWN